VGAVESLLVERIIFSTWRLGRLGRVEAGIFARELYGEMADRARKEAETYTSDLMDFVRTADITITDEDKHREALSKAEEMEAMQDSETATLGQTFIRDANKANAFSKLSRYETTIERSLFKALHEL
jgi:PHD/YefM family antitoxin component YafN of YafNO toxin-antitoxin module